MEVTRFLKEHYRHFNAATLVDAAEAYKHLLAQKGKMLVTLAGAMSTAELGRLLSEMIAADKIHAICCTGANLEEDVFNLVAHEHYVRIPNYRELSAAQEQELLGRHLNRVTDTCIPEEEAIRRIEHRIAALWQSAHEKGESYLPHEYFYQLFADPTFSTQFQLPESHSWLAMAAKKKLPLYVPGWEDSTLGNIFASYCYDKKLRPSVLKTGIDYMVSLASWYEAQSASCPIGFFQIGGGIAGDFPICVVPMLNQDLGKKVPVWSYFCQISDSTTSFGSYSGAVPNEKITWGKLSAETPRFVIESDATIVAPLIFAVLLGK